MEAVRRGSLIAAVLAGAALAVAGCGGGSDEPSADETTDTTETTETVVVSAAMTSFVPGLLVCSAEGEGGSVTVSWTTADASGVRLEVDGEEAAEVGPSGIEQIDVPCDGQKHTLSATPLSDEGEGRPFSRVVGPGG